MNSRQRRIKKRLMTRAKNNISMVMVKFPLSENSANEEVKNLTLLGRPIKFSSKLMMASDLIMGNSLLFGPGVLGSHQLNEILALASEMAENSGGSIIDHAISALRKIYPLGIEPNGFLTT